MKVEMLQLLPPPHKGLSIPTELEDGKHVLLLLLLLQTSLVTRRSQDAPCPLPPSKSQARTSDPWDLVGIQDPSCKGCR